ncbi:MAG: dTDP-4-dehydrorhamnose reductase [Candidatus Omnitrophota bacterium]|nr:dTDP-4-dehydrorhamnose reductase [Candidatus Omnitrophota bacterium]
MEKNKKIIVTGARGMLGHALCATLENSFAVEGIDKEELDITSEKDVSTFFKKGCPDALIHCAAYTAVDRAQDEPEKAYAVNALGTRAIAGALAGSTCLYIYLSTDYVFDGTKSAPYDEGDAPNPLGVYGRTKLAGERFVKEYPHHLIVRTGWLFGPGGPNFIKTIIQAAGANGTLRVVNDQVGSPTYTRNLASAIHDMVRIYFRKGIPERIYHVTGSGSCSWYELACKTIAMVGSPAAIVPITSSELSRKAPRPKNSRLSNEKFYALTGHYLPSWQETLGDYLKGTL